MSNSAGPVPQATYRVQLGPGFGFSALQRLIPYLDALGVSHVYTSPYVTARPGSSHGYDVANPNALNPELGTVAEYARMTRALQTRGMGQIIDWVPNHMGIGFGNNQWWQDVLERGKAS